MIAPEQIISAARSWLGVPYVHQGRSRNGVDCIGLVYCVAREVGCLPMATTIAADYPRRVKDAALLDGIAQACTRLQHAEAGCVVLVKWPRDAVASHVAIFTGNSLIHSYQRVGRVVQHGYRSPWSSWTHSLWRLPGVARE